MLSRNEEDILQNMFKSSGWRKINVFPVILPEVKTIQSTSHMYPLNAIHSQNEILAEGPVTYQ